jgi:hypothetical protein
MPLTALAFNCTLKPSPAASSTEKLLREMLEALGQYDTEGDIVRAVDFNIKPGVRSDEGEGDDWPELRETRPRRRHPAPRLADLARPAFKRIEARA